MHRIVPCHSSSPLSEVFQSSCILGSGNNNKVNWAMNDKQVSPLSFGGWKRGGKGKGGWFLVGIFYDDINQPTNSHGFRYQEFIDIVETIYRGARKGRGLVMSPKAPRETWVTPGGFGTNFFTTERWMCWISWSKIWRKNKHGTNKKWEQR